MVRPSHARVRCSYARDGHSTTKERGCGIDNWCAATAVDEPWDEGYASCAWKGDELDQMMQEQAKQAPRIMDGKRAGKKRQLGFARLPVDLAKLDPEWLQSYNEVILDGDEWKAELPSIIEAVFMLDGASAQHQQRAIEAHAAFLQSYGLREEDCPLLIYDPARSIPFRLSPEPHRVQTEQSLE